MSFRHINRHRSSPPVVVLSDINEVVDSTDPTQMDCQLHIPDAEASASFSDDEEDTEPKHYDVVPDGDVIFELDYNVFIRVSSVVLTITSECFRKMLTGSFMEGNIDRSATTPQRIHLPEQDAHAMHRFFCILHHKPDPDQAPRLLEVAGRDLGEATQSAASKLRDLAQVFDYYQCAEPLARVAESLLSDFALPSVRDAMPFQPAVDLVVAAHWMRQPRYFCLFTKRLITDHTEDFSANWPEDIAQSVEEGLEVMSNEAWSSLYGRLRHLATGTCETSGNATCLTTAKDATILRNLTDRLLPPGTGWPHFRRNGITLRHLLSGLFRMERLQRVLWCGTHEVRTFGTVGPEDFVPICWMFDRMDVPGLCLMCTRRNKERCVCGSKDATHASTMRFIAGDSYLLGAGDWEKHAHHGSRPMESAFYGKW